MALVSFFGLALPGYALVRKVWPESGWNFGGNVSTSVIQPFDIVVVGGYLMLFVVSWKGLPETMAEKGVEPTTVGRLAAQVVGMIFLTVVIPAVLFWRVDLREFFGLRWGDWKKVFWIAPAFVFAMMAMLSAMLGLGWQGWVETNYGARPQEMVTLLKESEDVGLMVVMAISAVIVAPLTEEVIFRGYLYPVVKRFSDRWFAALFTGVIFGVIHFNLLALPTLAVMGVVLVILYEVTGSLWVPIACHAAFNATTVGAHLIPKIFQAMSPS